MWLLLVFFSTDLHLLFLWCICLSDQCSVWLIHISDFSGFVSRRFGLFWKFSLRSFRVKKRLILIVLLSSIIQVKIFRKAFTSVFIAFIAHMFVFLYVLLMFSISNLLYSSVVSSYKLLFLSAGIKNFKFFYISHISR